MIYLGLSINDVTQTMFVKGLHKFRPCKNNEIYRGSTLTDVTNLKKKVWILNEIKFAEQNINSEYSNCNYKACDLNLTFLKFTDHFKFCKKNYNKCQLIYFF